MLAHRGRVLQRVCTCTEVYFTVHVSTVRLLTVASAPPVAATKGHAEARRRQPATTRTCVEDPPSGGAVHHE